MSTVQIGLLGVALLVLAGGIRMMYCGHRHQVRRDRRSTDRKAT